MRHLCDTNVFFALAVSGHRHHAVAQAWLDLLGDDSAEFCRMTFEKFVPLGLDLLLLEKI